MNCILLLGVSGDKSDFANRENLAKGNKVYFIKVPGHLGVNVNEQEIHGPKNHSCDKQLIEAETSRKDYCTYNILRKTKLCY